MPRYGGVAPRRQVGVLPMLMAILMAAGLVGLIAWQATPWLSNQGKHRRRRAPAPAPPPKPAAPEEKRPSAVGPPETKPPEPVQPASTQVPTPEPPAEEPEPGSRNRRNRGPRRAGPVPIMVPTNPPGATVALDGRADTECRTPCTHHGSARPPHRFDHAARPPDRAPPDRRGQQPAGTPADFSLRGATGTLMLNTAPPGATILIDGSRGRKAPRRRSI